MEVIPAEGLTDSSTGSVGGARRGRLGEAGISNGRTNRLGRMVLDRRGNRISNGRIIRRRRSGRRLCLDKFVLFDQDDNIIGSRGNTGDSGLEAESGRGVSDIEKFR